MAGLAITPPPVHLSLFDRPQSAFTNSRRRRRLRGRSLPFAIPEGAHGPVHSLTFPNLSAAGLGSTADYNKHSLQPTATVEALTLPLQEAEQTTYSLRTKTAGPVPRVRSLDMAAPVSRVRSMPVDMAVPDSPPDLSSSRSSKSSGSFRSSILSDAAGNDLSTHFEDISLGEGKRDSYDLNAQKDGRSRTTVRPLHSMVGQRKKPPPTVDTMRSVHMAQRRPGQPGKPTGVLDEKCTNMPASRMMRPGFRSNSGGSFAPRSPTRFGDSRSPSPTKSLMSNGQLQRSAASIPGSTAHSFLSVHHGPARRKTWAPGRKTVKQLEDEYHDSDEEVPEDAIIWNVPVSPLEPFTTASRDPSPRRQSSQSSFSSAGDRPDMAEKYPSAPSTAVLNSASNSSSPHLLTLPRSATTGSFPSEPMSDLLSLRERHKSWTNDLSSDAKHVALALEAHASRVSLDTRTSTSTTPLASPPNTATAASFSRRQSTSSHTSLPLPPIQSSALIDPLPLSKEKEAVLTRTRPAWLPPKCQKEERKHLKEWERMMAQSVVAERRRAARQLEQLEERKYSEESQERIWEDYVLPQWDEAVKDVRTRELWWRGVNGRNRGEVWRRAVGNGLQLTQASYEAALGRAKANAVAEEVMKQIKEDASTALPETGLFTPDAPLLAALVDVLMAHAAYRPDVGYKSGMHRVAALLLLNMAAPEAFVTMANVLSRPLPAAYLTGDRQGIEKWTSLVLSTMKVKVPGLHDHFLSSKVAPGPSNMGEKSDEVDMTVKRVDSKVSSPALDSLRSPDLSEVVSPLSRTPTLSSATGSRPTSRMGGASRPGSSRGPRTGRAIPAEGLIAPMLSTLFTAHLDLETLSRIWDVYVFEGDKLLVRAFVGICAAVEGRLYGDREEVLAVIGEINAFGKPGEKRGLGDLETERIMGWVREAGKVGERKGSKASSPKN